MTMKEVYAIFQKESDNCTYCDEAFVKAFADETVAGCVAEELYEKVGYVTRFGEERTFSVRKITIQPDLNLDRVDSIVKKLKKEFDW
jgi:hypothetical protein